MALSAPESRPGARTWAAAAPCLMAAAPVVALWSNNAAEVDAQVALIPLVLAPATAALLLAALGALLRDAVRGAAVTAVVVLPTVLMILFRKKYPKWWFDWNLAFTRFEARIAAIPSSFGTNIPPPTRNRPSTSTSSIPMPQTISREGSPS